MRCLIFLAFIIGIIPLALAREGCLVDTSLNQGLISVVTIIPTILNSEQVDNLVGKCTLSYKVNKNGRVDFNSIKTNCNPRGFFDESCKNALKYRLFINNTEVVQAVTSECIFEAAESKKSK